ncbi:hypothetical protein AARONPHADGERS_31 [Bacillus phage AaronPhadgers]|nr:hypothetical protein AARONPHADGERS_31 [Bacillus phage AaronPhadgers]
MSQLSTVDAVMLFFLTWTQGLAYMVCAFMLCKGLYTTIQKLCEKRSIISRAGWCMLLIVIPALLSSTLWLWWEFLGMSAADMVQLYQNYKTS